MIKHIRILTIVAVLLFFGSCESKLPEQPAPGTEQLAIFPSYITVAEDYFETSIGNIPEITGDSYQLRISGALEEPGTFSLEELFELEMFSQTLTTECIGNPGNGNLLGTARWSGFKVYDLLKSLGIKEEASAVRYLCADGYYTYNSLEQLKDSEVMGALLMNDESIPAKHGFPLRIIIPGYYGVRHPGWIVEIEVLESGDEDYWTQRGWQTELLMAVDSKIFFPEKGASFSTLDSIKIGGSAYGGKRISKVEVTLDKGVTWFAASVRESLDEDFVWVFWELILSPLPPGVYHIHSRATDENGSTQPWSDNDYLNGTNALPSVSISVE